MSEHPIALSTRMIDTGIADAPPNRITQELSELADGVALIESFSHVVAVDTGEGIVAFDSSSAQTGRKVVESLRTWNGDPVHSIVYTHGHLDHVGGSRSFAREAIDRGRPVPRVLSHERVVSRLNRYAATSGYNQAINARQFGGAARAAAEQIDRSFIPEGTLYPDLTYSDRHSERIGDVDFEHNYCKGETDDHTWTWIPQYKMVCAGDQFIWNFPNCGNPQKVQRYPVEWAESLREMAAKEPELFVPAHGLPIAGKDRIAGCLSIVAETLEMLATQVLDAMNTGATLDEILHSVSVPQDRLELPFLRPLYDEPEFVIRNIWRLYGGWYDGNPSRLKPPSDRAVGIEIAALAGGVDSLVARSSELSANGDHRLACHLIELAVSAEPEAYSVHEARSAIYTARRQSETSLMAKGIFKSAAADSKTILDGEAPKIKVVLALGE